MPLINHYEDLEQLLFKGFLTDRLHFQGFDFVLKSLTDHEFQRVQDRTPSKHPAKAIFYDCWYVAYSIFQINGISFLQDERELIVVKLYKSLLTWPHKAVRRLISRCLTINKRINDAYTKFEAYCYENQSRTNWRAYSGLPLNSVFVTGFKGTEQFPLSTVQIQWINFNKLEDERNKFEEQWGLARWSSAFLNQKAADQVDKEVQDQKAKEEQYRAEVRARAKGLSDRQDKLDLPSSKRQDDLEKLLYDLDVVINDKKDEHELTMDQVRSNAIEEYRAFKREERDRRILAIKEQSTIQEANTAVPFVIFDEKSMSNIEDMERRKSLITSVLGVSREELDAIDEEFTLPKDLLDSVAPAAGLSRSTILPVNINPGNFSGEFTRGGLPVNHPRKPKP
jgi:hypothetical protein